MKLLPSEFMEDAPIELGAQVHVNHEGCPEGLDRKKRLYIKRLPDNSVLAYCHHCGSSGYYADKITNIHTKNRIQATNKPTDHQPNTLLGRTLIPMSTTSSKRDFIDR